MNSVALPPVDTTPPRIAEVLKRYWGFETLRPLQMEAINASLGKRDSLVVMPTGGGKSLCYQLPPLVANRTDIVVSPLISLMKDQVDALTANGYPAAALHSGLNDEERRNVMLRMSTGELRLVFVAPERLLTQSFLSLAERLNVRSFAIDEAHCISQWGHDFRPEYSKLALLKKRFPEASIHAYTATATERVQRDIIKNLGLAQTKLIIGRFDRPNLTYRVTPRSDVLQQVLALVRRHRDEAVIVYCISRKDAEQLAEGLKNAGVRAAPYHAGLDPRLRARTQEAFAAEKIDVVVATVAFGMGIDRSNVRCVIHAGMPKSIEAYQQETGRAGRDGLEAECVLLYSPQDLRRWEFIVNRSAEETEQAPEITAANLALIRQVQEFCTSNQCRHAALSRYFGQEYQADNCQACDICTDEQEAVDDAGGVVQQILGCVGDLRVSFGAAHVVDILTGGRGAKVTRLGHDNLAQHGKLRRFSKDAVKEFIGQLIGEGLLLRTTGEMPVLRLTSRGQQALSGKIEVKLTLRTQTAAVAPTLEFDHGLFESLRELRKEVAAELQVAAFVIFSDVTLRDLAAVRPSSIESFRGVKGIGDRKAADFGERFVTAIEAYCRQHGLTMDQRPRPPAPARGPRPEGSGSTSRQDAFGLFDAGASLEDLVSRTGRSLSTVVGYLEDYITLRKPANVDAWVSPQLYQVIEAAARDSGGSLLRPVFDALAGQASYEEIRVVMRHAGLR